MNITPVPAILPVDFYVYEHRKATTGEVFYVGKGVGRRAWFTYTRSRHWKNIAKKHGAVVCIVQDGLQEWYAHEFECELIALHGRFDIGLGPLINFTDGGEGTSGRVMPEAQRVALSLAKSTPEAIAKHVAINTGRKHSLAAIRKMSAAKLGKPATAKAKAARILAMNRPEVKAKLAAAQLGRATEAQLLATGAMPVRCNQTGEVFPSLSRAAKNCRSMGRPTTAASIQRSCETQGQKKAGGYTWRYA